MKKMNVVIPFVAVMLAWPLAHAGEGHATHQVSQDGPLLLAQAETKAGAADKGTQQVQDHMSMMKQRMDKYHASKDQKERRQLMTEITKDMRDHMKMMRGSGGMGSGGMMGGDPKKRQEMMEMRMDQMHQMMEWMFTFQLDFPISAP